MKLRVCIGVFFYLLKEVVIDLCLGLLEGEFVDRIWVKLFNDKMIGFVILIYLILLWNRSNKFLIKKVKWKFVFYIDKVVIDRIE